MKTNYLSVQDWSPKLMGVDFPEMAEGDEDVYPGQGVDIAEVMKQRDVSLVQQLENSIRYIELEFDNEDERARIDDVDLEAFHRMLPQEQIEYARDFVGSAKIFVAERDKAEKLRKAEELRLEALRIEAEKAASKAGEQGAKP